MAGITKLISPEVTMRRNKLLPLLAVLLVCAGIMQAQIDPTARKMRPSQANTATAYGGLNNEFLILPLLGFREAAAGLLWVRCDEFFHSGDYDAILPLVRLITWLDPHADNVYITGAWHLSYNFTDSSERSDRRYIAPSQALLKEGVVNNPNIPDINFELGWENYDKIKDFVAAETAFKAAIATPPNKKGDDYPYGAPLKDLHILAHTYEKQGRLPEAIAEWGMALERSAKEMILHKGDFSTYSLREAEKHNREQDIQRWHDRYTTTSHSDVNTSKYPAVIRPTVGNPQPHPWDVAFSSKVEAVRPKVLKVGGRINTADGARVDVRLTDWNYTERDLGGQRLERFDVDQSQTIMMDMLSVRKGKFEREIDMSKDPKMYSFQDKDGLYRLTLSFNPRTTAPHVQDQFGYSGEGMTDSSRANLYFPKDPKGLLAGTVLIAGQDGVGAVWDGVTLPHYDAVKDVWLNPDNSPRFYGQPPRMVKIVYKLTQAQIQGLKPITDQDIVPNSD